MVMKRIFILLSIFMLIIPSIGVAENTTEDFMNSIDTETLQYLALTFKTEYYSRPDAVYPFDVPAGVYVIGTNFPIGIYSFDIVSYSALVSVYRNTADYYDDIKIPIFEDILGEMFGRTTIGSLFLAEGNVLVVEGQATARPFLGL